MYKYYVSKNQKISPSTLLLTLRKDTATKPLLFQSGQYAAISFKRHGRPTPTRCFSIVNSPTDEDVLQCSIRTKGRFTRALTELSEGEEVNVRGSFGGFIFNPQRDLNMVLIAGGIGIAPFMSMMQYASDKGLKNNITLLYSNSNQDDVPFVKQLENLEQRNPYLKVVYTISRGPTDKLSDYDVRNGRISLKMLEETLGEKLDNKNYFICGPTSFMNEAVRILKSEEIPDNKIFTEAFSQGTNNPNGKTKGLPFAIYVLCAIGLTFASVAVMWGDLISNAQPAKSTGTTNFNPSCQTSIRQEDLDELVNGTAKAQTNCTTTPTPTNTSAKTCTTTQSGVTTCL